MTRSPQPSARELASQRVQLRKQQEKLLSELLTVVDLLDRANDHWQQAEKASSQPPAQTPAQVSVQSLSWTQRLRQWLGKLIVSDADNSEDESLAEVVTSAREGIDMIRASMLGVLAQHQVIPLPAKGVPFDPETMHALGQQADASAPPNTVVQEVVRGYRWKERMLREAQVIVATGAEANGSSQAHAVQDEGG